MRRKGNRSGLSSNLITALVVGGFVGAVAIALVWVNFVPAVSTGNQLNFQELALFGGSQSTRSLNSTCSGDAQFEVNVQNPTGNNIQIQNVTIWGSGLTNATVLLEVSHSCLKLSEVNPMVPAQGTYQLIGYVNAPLRYTSLYGYYIGFSNGQSINGSLIAQT